MTENLLDNTKGVAQISKLDVIWNVAATFFKVGAGIILLPFILKYFPSDMIGIWTIFITVNSLVALLDFGFNTTFARNVSYVFSGVNTLHKTGICEIHNASGTIDYSLLKGLLASMKWFYSRMAMLLFILLFSIGTGYMYFVLKDYNGNTMEVYIAWVISCLFNVYNFYTLYYESLLLGKGLVKRSKQIVVIGRCAYLILAVVLIYSGFGIISVVSAQFLSMLIIRILSYRAFFTKEIKSELSNVQAKDKKDINKAITPNAIKLGLVFCSGSAVSQLTVFIGSLHLDLALLGSYGLTMQLVTILVTLSKLYIDTYIPKIVQYRTQNKIAEMKNIYTKGIIYFIVMAILGGLSIVLLAGDILAIFGSQTQLLSMLPLAAIIIFSLLDANQALSTNILLAGNEVPFLKTALITGVVSLVLILFFLYVYNIGVWALILGPGLAQIVYQDWKWPVFVYRRIFKKI